MANHRRLLRSFFGLIRLLGREMTLAAWCLLRGNRTDSREHLRFALQGLHEDLASLAGGRSPGAPLPSREMTSRVLLVKLDRVGDMVNTAPVFDFLRAQYPDAKIDIVGHPAVLSLLDDDPRVAERFTYKSALYHGGSLKLPGLAAWRLVRHLRKRRYPLVVYLRGSFPFLWLAPHTRFIASKFVEGEPVIRRYLKPLGAPCGRDDPLPLPSLHVSHTSRKSVLDKYPHLDRGPSVIIHAVSAADGKQWPLERFAQIADEIASRTSATILFLATPSEEEKLARIKTLCQQPHFFETDLRLPEVVAAISLADVFIGNDSGLAHIAAAVRTREVVIWGAANLEMARPVAAPHYCSILYHELPCRAQCPEIRCVASEHLKCLKLTQQADVVSEALRHLNSRRAEREMHAR